MELATRIRDRPALPDMMFELADHELMTQLWTFLAADDELAARERALCLAANGHDDLHATTSEAVEYEPGRWRIKLALQRDPTD